MFSSHSSYSKQRGQAMNESTHPVTMRDFETIIDTQPMVILDFWANWCAPCKMLNPIFEELAKHNTDIYFGKVDIESAKDLAEAFQVRSVPTLMAFKNGELVFEKSGLLLPQQISELLEQLRTMVPVASEEILEPEQEP
jgi:thioredoxin